MGHENPLSPQPSGNDGSDAKVTTVTARLNASVTALGVTITPLEVLEDSRCPTDVQCIWAGQVRLNVRIKSGLGASEMVLISSQAITTESETIMLQEVRPDKVSSASVKPEDYRFQILIEKR